jgi:hypothetical protein
LEVTVFHINDKSEFVGFLEVTFVAEGLQVLDPIAATRIDRDNVMHVERYLVSSIARSNGSTDSASVGVPDEHLIPKLLGNSPKRRLKLARDWNSSEDYCSNGLGLKIQAAQARDRISPAYLLAKAPHKTSRESIIHPGQSLNGHLYRIIPIGSSKPDGLYHSYDTFRAPRRGLMKGSFFVCSFVQRRWQASRNNNNQCGGQNRKFPHAPGARQEK